MTRQRVGGFLFFVYLAYFVQCGHIPVDFQELHVNGDTPPYKDGNNKIGRMLDTETLENTQVLKDTNGEEIPVLGVGENKITSDNGENLDDDVEDTRIKSVDPTVDLTSTELVELNKMLEKEDDNDGNVEDEDGENKSIDDRGVDANSISKDDSRIESESREKYDRSDDNKHTELTKRLVKRLLSQKLQLSDIGSFSEESFENALDRLLREIDTSEEQRDHSTSKENSAKENGSYRADDNGETSAYDKREENDNGVNSDDNVNDMLENKDENNGEDGDDIGDGDENELQNIKRLMKNYPSHDKSSMSQSDEDSETKHLRRLLKDHGLDEVSSMSDRSFEDMLKELESRESREENENNADLDSDEISNEHDVDSKSSEEDINEKEKEEVRSDSKQKRDEMIDDNLEKQSNIGNDDNAVDDTDNQTEDNDNKSEVDTSEINEEKDDLGKSTIHNGDHEPETGRRTSTRMLKDLLYRELIKLLRKEH